MQGGRGWIGGSEYIKNIVFALGNLPAELRRTFELNLLCNEALEDKFTEQIFPYLNRIYVHGTDLNPVTLSNRIWWKLSRSFLKIDNLRIESFFDREKIDFVYPFLSRTPKKNYRCASWIPDFQHKYLPDFFTPEEIKQRDKGFSNIAKYASTIVVSSKVAQSDLHHFFPETKDKSSVLSFRTFPQSTWYTGDPLQTQKKYHLPDRFFIISNQFWQHKNHLLVFEALKLLREKSVYPIVVCTGHIYDYRQPAYSDSILQTIHQWGLFQQVFLLGLIPKTDQVQLMRRALAVIQPSLFEGWSTLVEDARCLGKNLILSDLAVNKEQNPPNSIFFKRDSGEHLASLISERWQYQIPGPNQADETIAKDNSLKLVQTFGRAFLEIAYGDHYHSKI